MRRVVFIILSLIVVSALQGQITVTSGFAKDTVQLGEVVGYTITAKVSPQVELRSVDLIALDSIISLVQTQIKAQTDTTGNPGLVVGDYTISSYGRWQDISENKKIDITELSWDTTIVGNQILLENTFKISFWDAGPSMLKTPNVVYELGGISSEFISNSGAQVFVDVPFEEQELSDSIDIAPIKPIIVEEKDITDFYPFFYFIGFLLLLPLVYFIYKKVFTKPVDSDPEPEVVIPAHQIALKKLDSLRATKLWQKGEVKEYQTQLTYTIREYLENRYDIQALESSTDEITKALKKSNFVPSDERDLKTILQVADLVKFAKANPSEEIHEEFLNTAVAFVKKTKSNEAPISEVQPFVNQENSREIKDLNASSKSQEIDTPFNSHQPVFASFGRRLGAYVIDLVLFLNFWVIPTWLASVFFQVEGNSEEDIVSRGLIGILFIPLFIIIYYVIPQYKFRKTIGKKLLNIEIVNHKYENISLLQSVVRVIFMFVGQSMLYMLFLTFFFTKRNQTIHDLIAKTIVIKKDPEEDFQERQEILSSSEEA